MQQNQGQEHENTKLCIWNKLKKMSTLQMKITQKRLQRSSSLMYENQRYINNSNSVELA